MKIPLFLSGLLLISISCGDRPSQETATNTEEFPKIKEYLPFSELPLDDLSVFNVETPNWKIVGDVHVDRSKDRMLLSSPGKGILANIPEEDTKNGHIFTNFDHGDLELELDVMMPLNSNSGIYFQGRYEVQLLDSWGEKEPTYADIGGIYQSSNYKEEGGYLGTPPRTNASKSPGLWQHFKILFHAPRFNAAGEKITNAIFQEVWLNGMLIQENVEVTAPTRSSAFTDEIAKGPLMIQGDHGPVALKNIKYKKYENKKLVLSDIHMTEYDSNSDIIAGLDTLKIIGEKDVDSISANMVTGNRVTRILGYKGQMDVPNTGNYLFNIGLNHGGALLLIGKDTVVDLNGKFDLGTPGIGEIMLEKGKVPFTFIYNKNYPWSTGFSFTAEGPEMQKMPLHAKNSLSLANKNSDNDILITVGEETITQRGYMMHGDEKRTHCISVGSPDRINYSYDLSRGALLQVWQGDFLDVTQMWHSRGNSQLAEPKGFAVSFHGDPDFMTLENRDMVWPDSIPSTIRFRPMGYEIKDNGLPIFLHREEGIIIGNSFKTSKDGRGLERTISIEGNADIWHKMAEGESIKSLGDGTFIVNNESYFIDFSGNSGLDPIIRHSNGRDELIIKIPANNGKITYNIIW